MSGAVLRGTAELFVGERSGDFVAAGAIQEKMLGLALKPLVVFDGETGPVIYGQSAVELARATGESVGVFAVIVGEESAQLITDALEDCKWSEAYLAAAAVTIEGDLVAGNFLPEQIPSPMFLVHLERRV